MIFNCTSKKGIWMEKLGLKKIYNLENMNMFFVSRNVPIKEHTFQWLAYNWSFPVMSNCKLK